MVATKREVILSSGIAECDYEARVNPVVGKGHSLGPQGSDYPCSIANSRAQKFSLSLRFHTYVVCIDLYCLLGLIHFKTCWEWKGQGVKEFQTE